MPHVYTIDGAVVLGQETPEEIENQAVAGLQSTVEKLKRERWYLVLASTLAGLITGLLVGSVAK